MSIDVKKFLSDPPPEVQHWEREQPETREEWTLNSWHHQLIPEGHLWRWRATFCGVPESERQTLDFGLVPEGIFTAVKALVEAEWG